VHFGVTLVHFGVTLVHFGITLVHFGVALVRLGAVLVVCCVLWGGVAVVYAFINVLLVLCWFDWLIT